MKLVLVVPTKDRPKDIHSLFTSIKAQTRKPDLVIVVDGSDKPIEHVLTEFRESVPINYIPCRPPSLPKQRNVGIAAVPSDADWVGFLDDDLVLEADALEKLEQLIVEQNDPKLKGIGLCILNQPQTKIEFFRKIFLITALAPGKMTAAGYPSAIPRVEKDIDTDWLYGGATFWRREVFDDFKFDEWFFGTGYMEDIDFSYRVASRYRLMVSSNARCYHFHHAIPSSKQVSIGEWQITAWWYFIRKHRDFPIPLVLWGMLGLTLKCILGIFFFRSNDNYLRAKGHLRGVWKILTGKAGISKGFAK